MLSLLAFLNTAKLAMLCSNTIFNLIDLFFLKKKQRLSVFKVYFMGKLVYIYLIYYSVSIKKKLFTNLSFGLTIQWMVSLDPSSEICLRHESRLLHCN